MRVDDVPPWLQPLFHAYGYGVGALMQAASRTVRHGCRIVYEARAQLAGPRIECIWHENLPTYMAAYLPPPHGIDYVWMNHPAWYMRPVHLVLRWNGVKELALGSAGHGGRSALAQVVTRLREGKSTSMAADGPAGPPHHVKRGALDMALASGLPLVAVRFAYGRFVRTREWDRKIWPLPGSTVRIWESAPMHVTADDFTATRSALAALL